MLPRRRPTTLRACGVFARRSLPVVPSSPLAVWAGCPSLLRSVRLWITGTNVVEWNSRRVTRSTVPRFEVQVVMITPGRMLRSEIRSEIFDLPVPSRHGKERQKEERNDSLFSKSYYIYKIERVHPLAVQAVQYFLSSILVYRSFPAGQGACVTNWLDSSSSKGENLADLAQLQCLVLSHNNLSGSIPSKSSLSFSQVNIPDLSYAQHRGVFDLSYNRLSGTIPGELCGRGRSFDKQ
ncbi:hypothetical protein R6Q59_001572 [Mikania micrantha]